MELKTMIHPCSPKTKINNGVFTWDDDPPCQDIKEDIVIDYIECQKRCRGCFCEWLK
jgi:hypothetical protein